MASDNQVVLNYHLLGTCIGVITGSLLYFFYINRLVAFIIGFLLRVSFWNQGPSSIWLEIGEHVTSYVCGYGTLTERTQDPYTFLQSQGEFFSRTFDIIPATKLFEL